MATIQHFRSAFNGFNREDVVHYLEYLNNQHATKVNQLNSQLQAALAKVSPEDANLREQVDAALARCAQLEAELEKIKEEAQQTAVNNAAQELEAYRRAERAERVAKERAQQVYAQANAAIADVTVKAEAASNQIGIIADQVNAQLQQYQDSITGTKEAFQEAVAALYAIRPEED